MKFLCLTPLITIAFSAQQVQVTSFALDGGRIRTAPSSLACKTLPFRTQGHHHYHYHHHDGVSQLVLQESNAVAHEQNAYPPTPKRRFDLLLMTYFALWFAGNYFYKITNKLALVAAGGHTGFPMTVSALQLGVGAVFAAASVAVSPSSARPHVTWNDLVQLLPVAFCYLGSHTFSLFAFAAGSVSFGEIVKAAEPAFAAVLSHTIYHRTVSRAKWACLPLIIGGVCLASVSDLDFTWTALISGCIANLFAAVKHNENKKLLEGGAGGGSDDARGGIKERIGSVRNQFALTNILAFFMSLPFVIVKEGTRMGEFSQLALTKPELWRYIVVSALWFYNYNEMATRTLKKTGPVTSSVANTAKRVFVLVGSALRFGESLAPVKMIGSAICIGGVFLYSLC